MSTQTYAAFLMVFGLPLCSCASSAGEGDQRQAIVRIHPGIFGNPPEVEADARCRAFGRRAEFRSLDVGDDNAIFDCIMDHVDSRSLSRESSALPYLKPN